jgi:hypothetical protein
MLLAADAARVVPDGASLQPIIREYLDDSQTGHDQGQRAREVILPQQGATVRTVETLLKLLPLRDLDASGRMESTKRAA